MWDVKPTAPQDIRGPFQPLVTALPGVTICDVSPKQAAMLDQFTLIRSVDALHSNHEPNMVMQTGNREAEPRLNPLGHLYPAIGAMVAKFRGPEHPTLPAYVATMKDRSHLAWGGWLGKEYDPFIANDVNKMFQLPTGIDLSRVQEHRSLLQNFDRIQRDLDRTGIMQATDRSDSRRSI